MNSLEAKKILLAWRPGGAAERDPEVAEALEQARRDPALRQWLEKHEAFQQVLREAFQRAPVPTDLRERILARDKFLMRERHWRPSLILAAAAAVALLLGIGTLWVNSSRQDSFQTFRQRMVSAALRQYTMDLLTNDATQIRQFLSTNNAPADYVLPEGLARLPVIGAGLLSWQDRRVSMVCLHSTNQGTLFLFIVDRSAVKRPPSSNEEFVPVNKLMTVSWTQGNRTYLLAGRGGKTEMQQHF